MWSGVERKRIDFCFFSGEDRMVAECSPISSTVFQALFLSLVFQRKPVEDLFFSFLRCAKVPVCCSCVPVCCLCCLRGGPFHNLIEYRQ